MENYTQRCNRFRELHEAANLLLLPNAWDITSARVLEHAQFPAIGTTSLATAYGAGVADGDGATRDETMALARTLGALDVLVSVDIEGGFGDADRVGEVAAGLGSAGAVGLNIEDGTGPGTLVDVDAQTAKIRACRNANTDVFINARIDSYWADAADSDTVGSDSAGTFEEVCRRAELYLEAGADGIFIPAVTDPELIRAYCARIPAPINVLYSPNGMTIDELDAAGVARLSTGSFLFRNAAASTTRAINEIVAGRRPGGDVSPYSQFAG